MSQQVRDLALVRHLRRISDYIQGLGIENPQQRKALTVLAEAWDGLSPDGQWDAVLEAKLRTRPALFADDAPAPKIEPKPKPASSAVVEATTQIYKSSAKQLNVSQPDELTCQSACIAMAVGTTDVAKIRRELTQMGVAGDPNVMGVVLRDYLGNRYRYNGKASLEDMKRWLRAGEFLIIHAYFTPSGHVIGLDGLSDAPGTTADRFDVADPWSEFDGPSFSYNNPSVQFYDGYYSARLIYAAAVVAFSFAEARATYASGALDSNQPGAWVHRILPKS